MTLELNKVAPQIDEMGRVLAERTRQQNGTLPAVRELLCLFAHEWEMLRRVAASDAGLRLRCASPGEERLDGSWAAPNMPQNATIIATDGSQVFPDRHGVAFYYAINVGGIIFRHGTGQQPEVVTVPQLYFTEDQVYPRGQPISGDQVSAERDLAEMRVLANMTVAEPSAQPPCMALADGPLLIWLQRAAVPEDQQMRILADYIGHLAELQANDAAVAGFVSRPRSAEVVALLYLAHLREEERDAVTSLAETPFKGLTDRALFGYLQPGQRSALFERGTAANRDFRARGHTIHFFYLHTGREVARVEIPEWVARHPQKLDLVHATVYDQCRYNNGYPYVLTRADEQAVILGDEREVLEEMIARAIAQRGLPLPALSRKAQQKQVARWRRR